MSAFFFIPNCIIAQKGVLELLPGSELLGYDAKKGAHRLVGTVNFIYQGNTMYCDSAHYFDKINAVKAFGNVHVTKNDINLYCDSLYYNGKNKTAKLWGHVRVRDLEYKLSTDSLNYDANNGQCIYRNKGRIESITSNEVLTSQVGYFYPSSKNFFFKGNVRYKNEELSMSTDTLQFTYSKQIAYFYGPTKIIRNKTQMVCERGWYNVQTEEGSLMKNAEIFEKSKILKGDTLMYQPKIGKSTAKGNIFYSDTLEKTKFYGDYAIISEKERYSMITGHTLAVKVQKEDTIFIHADTLFNQKDSMDHPLFSSAYRNVKIYNRSIQSISDSLIFTDSNQVMQLFNKPIAWSKNVELKGDTMKIFINDSIIKEIHINENATAIMELDSGTFYNQVSGNEIKAFFKDQDLVRTEVFGNAQTIFYPEDTENTDSTVVLKRLGMNRLYSSQLKIILDSGEVRHVNYYDKPDGIFYPMEKIDKKEQFISNFSWNYLLRPKDGWSIVD
jgi:lipopolysaccharide export system protein LptA